MPGITTLEGRMGMGKSLIAVALCYLEYCKREVLRSALSLILDSASWDEAIASLKEKHGVSDKSSLILLNEALQIVKLEGEEAYRDSIKVISNNHLNFPYTHFDPNYFIEHMEDEELSDCIVLLDEAYQYFDGRSTSTKMNKLFTYFVGQTRKRGVQLLICTHHIDALDKRVRRHADVRGTCRFNVGPLEENKSINQRRFNWARVSFMDNRTGKRPPPLKFYGPAFWHLYDTTERIPMMHRQLDVVL